jgi:hypothetical protein
LKVSIKHNLGTIVAVIMVLVVVAILFVGQHPDAKKEHYLVGLPPPPSPEVQLHRERAEAGERADFAASCADHLTGATRDLPQNTRCKIFDQYPYRLVVEGSLSQRERMRWLDDNWYFIRSLGFTEIDFRTGDENYDFLYHKLFQLPLDPD